MVRPTARAVTGAARVRWAWRQAPPGRQPAAGMFCPPLKQRRLWGGAGAQCGRGRGRGLGRKADAGATDEAALRGGAGAEAEDLLEGGAEEAEEAEAKACGRQRSRSRGAGAEAEDLPEVGAEEGAAAAELFADEAAL